MACLSFVARQRGPSSGHRSGPRRETTTGEVLAGASWKWPPACPSISALVLATVRNTTSPGRAVLGRKLRPFDPTPLSPGHSLDKGLLRGAIWANRHAGSPHFSDKKKKDPDTHAVTCTGFLGGCEEWYASGFGNHDLTYQDMNLCKKQDTFS